MQIIKTEGGTITLVIKVNGVPLQQIIISSQLKASIEIQKE